MNRRLKKALPLLGALVFLMVGAALAVPTINLTVQDLGQGYATIRSNIKNAKITWNLNDTNPDYLKLNGGVTIDLSDSQNTIEDNGKIYVKLYQGTTLVAKGEVTLSSGTTIYDVDLTLVNDPNNDGKLGLNEFDEVYVVYKGP